MKKFGIIILSILIVFSIATIVYQVYEVKLFKEQISDYKNKELDKKNNIKKLTDDVTSKEQELEELKKSKKELIKEYEEWQEIIKKVKES